jgi:hypothetical protein
MPRGACSCRVASVGSYVFEAGTGRPAIFTLTEPRWVRLVPMARPT